MLKALVFDFDGVIVDTETAWYDIYKDWLKSEYDYDLAIQDYLMCVGADTKGLISFLKEQLHTEVNIEAFEQRAVHEFVERTKNLPIKEGVRELIQEAKQLGLYIALGTSATRKKPVTHLTRLGILDDFDALSTAELSAQIKPAPDIFLKAAELLGVKPEECLAIEDSGNGLKSAKRAGMPCLIVPNAITKYETFEDPYTLVTSLTEVDIHQVLKDFKTM